MKKIGFIGLGNMGLPMAKNLINAGVKICGYDVVDAPLAKLVSAGGSVAPNLEALVKGQDVVITMLQKGEQVREVCAEILPLMDKGSLYMDCSTIDVASSIAVHQLAKENQLLVVDAPVSGGVSGANAKTLTFMVGGEEKAFLQARSILSAMGQKIIHTGGAGLGQAAKTCNNMVLGVSMIAISEAFVLANKLGLSNEKLLEVLKNSSGQCWVADKYVPVPGLLESVPANNDYAPGFSALMMLKDLLLGQGCAREQDLNLPMGALATALYQEFNDKGNSNLDFSAIITAIKNS